MKAGLLAFACLLACAAGFVPGTPVWRNGASILTAAVDSKHALAAGNRGSNSKTRTSRAAPLSMGFDFGKMAEKMTDTRYARVRHILIEEKGNEAKARLEGLKGEIANDLDKFSEIATDISTCTSASNGGKLKLLARGETVPEFDEVAFNSEPGSVYGPVETEYGTHLIFVESCNKPQNTWKMLFDDVVKKVKGEEE